MALENFKEVVNFTLCMYGGRAEEDRGHPERFGGALLRELWKHGEI